MRQLRAMRQWRLGPNVTRNNDPHRRFRAGCEHHLAVPRSRPKADLQHLEVGQWVSMSPWGNPSERTAFKVNSFQVNEWLLWTKPDSTWVWQLKPVNETDTRLVTRIHAVYDWRRPITALLGVLLLEFGDFAMSRRMLRGIKHRAESRVGSYIKSSAE